MRLVCILLLLPGMAYAAGLQGLEAELAKEQQKAQKRLQTLERLTAEEKKLDAGLAEAEQRILALEAGLKDYQDKLTGLVAGDAKEGMEYTRLLAEQKKTEELLAETMAVLWEITGQRICTANRDMLDWAAVDRTYVWSVELYSALESYRQNLEKTAKQLGQVTSRRSKLAADAEIYQAKVAKEKKNLLAARLTYTKRLAELRQKKQTTEEELTAILSLVENLHFKMQNALGNIKNLQGRLPFPVAGEIVQPYNTRLNPPYRGVGFRTVEGAPVHAVAAGTVVHNDVLRGFGHVVVIQHEGEYYSIYAFLTDSPLAVGSPVSGAAKVGVAGYYPLLNGSGIYFELRFRQKAINPQEWFGTS